MRNGKDERAHLARLGSLVQKGHCPADALLDGLGGADADLRREILARARI
jgi:glutamate--cysteine ligase